MDATPVLKRKGAEAPEPWLDGVPIPATKIRRLDAAVPPVDPADAVVMPPAEPASAGVPQPPPQPFEVEQVPVSAEVAPVVVAPAANDERAIVVYQPAEAARNLLQGPLRPGDPIRVSPDWIRGIKSTVLQEASNHRALFEQLASRDENPNLAMVPWVPGHAHFTDATTTISSSAPATEMMDADQDADVASMEVEQDAGDQPQPAPPAGFALQRGAFQQPQWPPHHCMEPQQLQVPATSYQPNPVTWSSG